MSTVRDPDLFSETRMAAETINHFSFIRIPSLSQLVKTPPMGAIRLAWKSGESPTKVAHHEWLKYAALRKWGTSKFTRKKKRPEVPHHSPFD